MTVGKRIEKRWGKKEREGGVPDGWYRESPPPLLLLLCGWEQEVVADGWAGQ
jgi:hypothetical protein